MQYILKALSKGYCQLEKKTLIDYVEAEIKWYDTYFSYDYYKENYDRLDFLREQKSYEEEYLSYLKGNQQSISEKAKQYLQDHHKYLKKQYIEFNDEGYGTGGFWSWSYKVWCYLMEQLNVEQKFQFNFKFDFREIQEGIFNL